MVPRIRFSHSASDSPFLELGRPFVELGRFIGVADAREMLIVGPSAFVGFVASWEKGFWKGFCVPDKPNAVLLELDCSLSFPFSALCISEPLGGGEAVALLLLPPLFASADTGAWEPSLASRLLRIFDRLTLRLATPNTNNLLCLHQIPSQTCCRSMAYEFCVH